MPVTPEFVNLANSLVVYGYKGGSTYLSGLSLQPTFYVTLLYKGSIVAQLPVSHFEYGERSYSEQVVVYTGVDSSSASYTFDEVQLWAGNEYIITDDVLSSPVDKSNDIPISVTVSIELSVETNSVSLTVPVDVSGIPFIGNIPPDVTATTMWSLLGGCCNASLSPINVISYVILNLLIPTSYINQTKGTKFYAFYQILSVPITQFQGITVIAISVPYIKARLSGLNVVYQSQCTTVPFGTAFKPSSWMSNVVVGAFENLGGVKFSAVTIKTSLSTTNYYESVMEITVG
mgnify:CR=1 FL=1